MATELDKFKETKGLPEDLLQAHLDRTIRIPMRSHLRSLNLSLISILLNSFSCF